MAAGPQAWALQLSPEWHRLQAGAGIWALSPAPVSCPSPVPPSLDQLPLPDQAFSYHTDGRPAFKKTEKQGATELASSMEIAPGTVTKGQGKAGVHLRGVASFIRSTSKYTLPTQGLKSTGSFSQTARESGYHHTIPTAAQDVVKSPEFPQLPLFVLWLPTAGAQDPWE